MQLFICPFCGQRDETEFHYAGETGNLRPDGDVPAARWADYLYMRSNPKGAVREIWVHTACGELFDMERDSVSHAVKGSTPLAGERA